MPARGGTGSGDNLRILTAFGITRVPMEGGDLEVGVAGQGATLKVRMGEVSFTTDKGEERP